MQHLLDIANGYAGIATFVIAVIFIAKNWGGWEKGREASEESLSALQKSHEQSDDRFHAEVNVRIDKLTMEGEIEHKERSRRYEELFRMQTEQTQREHASRTHLSEELRSQIATVEGHVQVLDVKGVELERRISEIERQRARSGRSAD